MKKILIILLAGLITNLCASPIDDVIKNPNNKKVILEALKQDIDALKYADESLKKDKEVVLEALKNDREALKYADESLKKEPDILKP